MLILAAQMQEWDKDKFVAEAPQEYRLGAEKVAEFDKHIYLAMKRLTAGIAREIVDTSKSTGEAWYRLTDRSYGRNVQGATAIASQLQELKRPSQIAESFHLQNVIRKLVREFARQSPKEPMPSAIVKAAYMKVVPETYRRALETQFDVEEVELHNLEDKVLAFIRNNTSGSAPMDVGNIAQGQQPASRSWRFRKGENSLQHYNLVHKFNPMPQAMKIPAAKAAVDKEWGKLEKISAWNLTKVKSKKQVIDEARASGATVHFASLMDICHLKNAEVEAKHQKYKGRVVLRGDIVKDDSGSYAVFTEQGSSASQMTAAKIMDIISRLPGCDGQAADAVSAYTQVKMEDAHKLLKIPKSECPDILIRLPRHKWPKSWSSMEDPVVPLERNLYGHPLAGLYGKGNFRKSYCSTVGRRFPIGNAYSYTVKKGYSYLCMWMT